MESESSSSTMTFRTTTKKPKRSLLKRLWKKHSSFSHKKKNPIDSHYTQSMHSHDCYGDDDEVWQTSAASCTDVRQGSKNEHDDHADGSNDNNGVTALRATTTTTTTTTTAVAIDDEDLQEGTRLLQCYTEQLNVQAPEDALTTLNLALDVVSHVPHYNLTQELVCRILSLHLQLYRTTADDSHLQAARSLIPQIVYDTNSTATATTSSSVDEYLEASPMLLDLLVQACQWNLALCVATKLPDVEPLTLARVHLEMALMESNNNGSSSSSSKSKSGSQMFHLSECHQLLLASDPPTATTSSDVLYLSLWEQLAHTYGILGEEKLALACSQSRMKHLTCPVQIARGHYYHALHVCAPLEKYSLAVKETDLALQALRQSDDDNSDNSKHQVEILEMLLHQFKADMLCRRGCIAESRDVYMILLERTRRSAQRGPVDVANILFVLGKLSVRLKDFTGAIDYFSEELEITKRVLAAFEESKHQSTERAAENQHPQLAVSQILHELARVAEMGLMDFPMAIDYYQQALKMEQKVYQECKRQQQRKKNKKRPASPLEDASLLKDAKQQIAETKQCLGRVHFRMGDFSRAVKTTLAVDK